MCKMQISRACKEVSLLLHVRRHGEKSNENIFIPMARPIGKYYTWQCRRDCSNFLLELIGWLYTKETNTLSLLANMKNVQNRIVALITRDARVDCKTSNHLNTS